MLIKLKFKESLILKNLKCKVDLCEGKAIHFEYCSKHYKQLYRHGKILNRTRFDPNEIIINGDKIEIIIYDKDNKPKNNRIVADLSQLEKIKNLKWSLDSKGYPVTTVNKTEKIRMHRYILNLNEDLPVDHINKNKLDNTIVNLRMATTSENNANKSKQKNNTSGFTGVCFLKEENKWLVSIQYYRSHYNLGMYKSKDISISVRLKGEQLIFQEFAPNKSMFNIIIKDLDNVESIDELKEKAKILDKTVNPPKHNRLTQSELKNLCKDIQSFEYSKKDLALKYNCGLSSINRYIRNLKTKGAVVV